MATLGAEAAMGMHWRVRRSRISLWFCRVLGWHGMIVGTGFDGASFHARCTRCGEKGMIDSQGNFF